MGSEGKRKQKLYQCLFCNWYTYVKMGKVENTLLYRAIYGFFFSSSSLPSFSKVQQNVTNIAPYRMVYVLKFIPISNLYIPYINDFNRKPFFFFPFRLPLYSIRIHHITGCVCLYLFLVQFKRDWRVFSSLPFYLSILNWTKKKTNKRKWMDGCRTVIRVDLRGGYFVFIIAKIALMKIPFYPSRYFPCTLKWLHNISYLAIYGFHSNIYSTNNIMWMLKCDCTYSQGQVYSFITKNTSHISKISH